MTSTTLEKTLKTKAVAQKKSKMGYIEALEHLEKCNAIIKLAAAKRVSDPEVMDMGMRSKDIAKSILMGAVGAAGCVVFSDAPDAGLWAAVAFLGIAEANVVASLNERWRKITSPLKFWKESARLKKEVHEWENQERQFQAVLEAVRSEARKAIGIINDHVILEGKEVVFSNSLGNEGFEIVKSSKPDSIRQAKFSALKEKESVDMPSLGESRQESARAIEK